MRSGSMASKARKRILRRYPSGDYDPFGEWTLPCAMAVDLEVVCFGSAIGFSDGSALSRRCKWRKGRDGKYHWLATLSAWRL